MKLPYPYQFVTWFPEWFGFGFIRPDPKRGIALIYEWFLGLGFWELRKWRKPYGRERS